METGITVIEEANVEAVRDMFASAARLYVTLIRTHSASIQASRQGDADEAERLGHKEDVVMAERAVYCTCISHLVEQSAREVMDISATVGTRALAEL